MLHTALPTAVEDLSNIAQKMTSVKSTNKTKQEARHAKSGPRRVPWGQDMGCGTLLEILTYVKYA